MDKPNILFIVCDQMTVALTGVYGHPVVKTPNLDRLAARGVRFDSAYTPCPICAPARACLVSGKYPSTNGCFDNATTLHCDEPCYPHYLTNAGYDTVLSGKMHFTGPDQLHGYRARFVRNIYPTDFRWTPMREYKGLTFGEQCIPPATWGVHAQAYLGSAVQVGAWHSDLAYDEEAQFRALSYLSLQGELKRRAAKKGTTPDPWCLTVSYHHPHEPYHPRQELWDLYEDEEIEIPRLPENIQETYSQMDLWMNEFHGCERVDLMNPDSLRRLRRAYYAMITFTDQLVGEVLDHLEKCGLAENTVIVFTSDHGDMLCEKGMVQKRSFYDFSARVPIIISMPDGTGAGRVVRDAVNLIDLVPTFLDLAGVPEEDRAPMDGRSLLPFVKGTHPGGTHTFSEMHSDGIYTPCYMVRKGPFKYNYIHEYRHQLFNMEEDPGEWKNLVDDPAHQAVAEEMRALVLGFYDPEETEKMVTESIKKRRIVQWSNVRNKVSWNVQPDFDKDKNSMTQYMREDWK